MYRSRSGVSGGDRHRLTVIASLVATHFIDSMANLTQTPHHRSIVMDSGCGCCARCLCYFSSIAIRRPDRPTGPESMAPKLRKKVCQSAGRAQTVRSARVDPRTLTSPVGRMSAAEAAEQAFLARLEPAEWEFDEHVPMLCSGVAEAAEQAFVARLEPAEWEFDDHVPMGCSGVDH